MVVVVVNVVVCRMLHRSLTTQPSRVSTLTSLGYLGRYHLLVCGNGCPEARPTSRQYTLRAWTHSASCRPVTSAEPLSVGELSVKMVVHQCPNNVVHRGFRWEVQEAGLGQRAKSRLGFDGSEGSWWMNVFTRCGGISLCWPSHALIMALRNCGIRCEDGCQEAREPGFGGSIGVTSVVVTRKDIKCQKILKTSLSFFAFLLLAKYIVSSAFAFQEYAKPAEGVVSTKGHVSHLIATYSCVSRLNHCDR